MDLVEYQGKQYFAALRHSRCRPERSRTPSTEAGAAAERLGYPVVVKAQVQVGGRGKAGGIKLAAATEEVGEHAGEHPGTGHQGPRGHGACGSRRRQTSPRSTTRASRSTVPPSCTSQWSRPGAGSTSSRSPRRARMPIARLHVNPLDGVSVEAARAGRARAGHRPGGAGRAPPRSSSSSTSATSKATPTSWRSTRSCSRPTAGARPGRQGDPRRRRGLPPSRNGRRSRTRASRRTRAPRQVEGALTTSASKGRSGSSPTVRASP